jgi:adenosylmethionine-8-amino-7-oxononanoate aminotransferase
MHRRKDSSLGRGIFVTATDTEVGKTVIAAGIAGCLKKQGVDVGVMKPIQSGALKRDNKLISPDAEFLIKASGINDERKLVTPFCFEPALSPNIASRLDRKKIDINKILSCFDILIRRHDFVIVEGIGGILVPIRDNYFVIDLIKDLGLPIIIVSPAALGTINHTLLTVQAARDRGIEVFGVIINNYPDKAGICERTNPQIISKISGIPIIGLMPTIKNLDVSRNRLSNLVEVAEQKIDIDKLQAKSTKQNNLKELDKRYLWHPFTQMKDWLKDDPLIIQEAGGAYLRDTQGRWYLDGISSLWVNLHGHRHQVLDKALKQQIDKVSHSTLLGLSNVPAIRLAEQLARITPAGLDKVFYSDNGSTAVEIALKMAYQYWQHKGKIKKTKFVHLENSYHGDTIGAVSVGGIDLFHKIYNPLLFKAIRVDSPYCYRCPKGKNFSGCRLDCLARLKEVLVSRHNQIAALIVEPIVQAAAGIIVWPRGILAKMSKLCKQYNVLLIADEVATGFGRTGKMFACEHEKVAPDILCLGKGISAGYLPLAATLTTNKIYNAFLADYDKKKTFFHGHTYTGNPLACSLALASLDIFRKEKTLAKLQDKIKFLNRKLIEFKRLRHVGDIRHKGFMVGIELVKDKKIKAPYQWDERIGIKVCQNARRYGIVLRPLGNVVVLMPPLAITREDLERLLMVTYRSIKEVCDES